MNNLFNYNTNRDLLRKVTVKIGLERIDMQEGVIVEVLLDSGVMRLVMSSEFTRKQEFKLKKIERSIYRDIKREQINVIDGQKWSVILEMLWLAYYSSKIDWRIKKVKMIRYLKKYKKQWRPKQKKLEQQKQKEQGKREEEEGK